ncbi:MAG: hypothetical protein JW709_00240 [Sedimentisphaerales bacterium]|nr:hypothetical protein [Sedimentisphaerales bacterium]
MSYLRRWTLLATILLALLTNCCFAVAPTVLRDVPGDAALILATQPLSELSIKADSYARKMGLPIAPEEPIDLGAMLSGKLEIPGLIDPSRGLALIITDLEQAEETLMLFLPITDPKTAADVLTGNGATPHPDMPGAFQRMGEDSVAMVVGNYLAMASDVEQFKKLSELKKGVTLSASDAKVFAENDVAAVINLAGIMPKLREQMLEGLANMPEEAKTSGNEQMMTMMVDRISECQTVTLGFRLGDAGINMVVNMLAKPGSTLATYLANNTKTTPAALAKLPAGSMIFGGSVALNPEVMSSLMDALIDMNLAAVKEENINKEEIIALRDVLHKTYESNNKGSFALYTPSAPSGSGMNMCMVVHQDNLAETMKLSKSSIEALNKLYQQGDGKMPVITYTENAGKVGDLSYNEVVADLSQMEMNPEGMQALTMVFGSPKFTVQSALVKENIMASGIGEGMLEQAVSLVNNSTTSLDKQAGVAKAAQNLPPQANAYLFVDIQGYSQFVMQMMMGMAQQNPEATQGMMIAMGMMGQLQGTAGWAATAEDGILKTEAFIPMETVQSVANIGMMMLQSMGGGMGPGQEPQGSSGSTF